MSGYIVNPFSSDINPMQNNNNSFQTIPVAAYGLIGITSLTLAYLTMIDSSQDKKTDITSPSVSATSMLPSNIFGNKSESKESTILPSPIAAIANPVTPPPMAEAERIEENKELKPGYGGKKQKKNITKNNKRKQKKQQKQQKKNKTKKE